MEMNYLVKTGSGVFPKIKGRRVQASKGIIKGEAMRKWLKRLARIWGDSGGHGKQEKQKAGFRLDN